MKRVLCLLIGLCCVGCGSLSAQGTPPLLEKAAVQTTASAERSTLNRTTGELSSSVEVVAVNVSGRRINGPVHAVVSFKSAAGAPVTAGVKVSGSEGGLGQAPWQQPWFDLTAEVGEDGWQPGEVLRLPLTFSRNRALQVLYEVAFAGRLNRDPVVDAGGPYSGQAGSAIVFSGAAEDADGNALTFAWDFGDGTQAQGPQAEHAFSTAGAKNVKLTVDDGNGGVISREVTALVIPSGQFALAHTRVVEGAGHPLAGAAVEETGPQGSRALPVEDAGFVSLGAGAGEYLWKFSAPGYLPVWRKSGLAAGDIKLLPSPWLAAQGSPTPLSVLERLTLTNPAAAGALAGAVRVVFPAGAFTQPGEARLTALGPQVLPFPLAFGWSPLAAFHLDLPEEPTAGAGVRLKLSDVLAAGELVTIVQFDRAALAWKVVAHRPATPGKPDECTFTLTKGGTWAALVPDVGAGAPDLPDPGEVLVPGAAQNLSEVVTAIGSAQPPEKAASLDPEAVTGEGEAVFTPAAGILPSGSWFRLGVQEIYDLTDGTGLRTPDYDVTVYAYRRPVGRTVAGPASRKVAAGAVEGSVSRGQLLSRQLPRVARAAGEGRPAARFPLRPRLLFSTAELKEAILHVEVLPPLGTGASVLSREGGVLESGGLRVTVPPDALGAFAAGSLRALDPRAYAGMVQSGYSIAGVFELNLSGLAPGALLGFSLTPPAGPEGDFLLTRLVSFPGGSGLAPVQRLHRDAAGVLTNAEPASPPRLSGLDGPGQYLLVQLPAPQGLVGGVVSLADGNAAPDIGVRITGQPWLSVTKVTGRYFLTAPKGPGTLLATHFTNGEGASAPVTMPSSLAAQTVDLTLGSVAPRVVLTTPLHLATKVATVTPLSVEFSERTAPASLGAAPVTLRAQGATEDVPAGFTLDLANRLISLLPVNPLEPGTSYTLTVSAAIRDQQNLALEGSREFTFTTAAAAARGEGAQLVIYEPGATGPTDSERDLLEAIPGYTPGSDRNKVVALGGPGTADPGVAVVLVNETSGRTATVLSKPDGSFGNFIEASVEDFISAVFVNGNGTRVTIPASRQKFDDGRTGLYQGGGILEASNEEPSGVLEAKIEVPPATIVERVVFKMEPVPLPKLLNALEGSLPQGASVVGGVIASHEGNGGAEEKAQVEFVIDASRLTLPPGVTRPEDAVFLLTSVQEIDGVLVYEQIDTMGFRNGKLSTNISPPDALAGGTLPRRLAPRLDGANARLKNVAEGLFKGMSFPDIVKKQFIKDVKDVLKELSFTSLKKMKQPNALLAKLGLPSVGDTVMHQLLLPVMMAQGTTTNLGGRVTASRQDDQGFPVGEAQFVAGAVVSAERPPLGPVGRVRPGEVVAQTNATGDFIMRLDVGLEGTPFVLSATHPRFPGQRPEQDGTVGKLAERLVGNAAAGGGGAITSGVNVQLAKIQFVIPPVPGTTGPDESAPGLRASHLPVLPATGLAAGDAGAILTVAAVDARDVASLTVTLLKAETFAGAALDLATRVSLSTPEILPSSGARQEQRLVVKCATPGRVTLQLSAADASGNQAQATYVIDFARPPLVAEIEPGNGPRVLSVSPTEGTLGAVAFPEIRLRFTKLLPAAAFLPRGMDWLTLDAGHYVVSVEQGLDRREAVVRFSGRESGPVSVTIGSPLTDEAGHPFDQNPDEKGAQAFVLNFSLALPAAATLDLERGGGAGLLGGYLFGLDRLNGLRDGKLVVYDLADPSNPKRSAEAPVPGEPGDLAVLPSWSVIPRPGDGPVTKPFVAVVSGEFGSTSDGNAGAGFKSLRLFDVSNPLAPAVFARGNVSFDPTSKIVKLAAVPPFAVYQEQSADVTSLHVVDLAAFVLGMNATNEERLAFPTIAQSGVDLNGDGDYTDGGEKNALPARSPATFFGDAFSYAPETRSERLVDFSLTGRGLLGVITTKPANNQAFYRNVLTGSDPGDPAVGSLVLEVGEDPKRVTVLTDVPIRVAGQRRLLDLALLSLRTDALGKPALLVLDLSDPRVPKRLGQMPLEAADGVPNTLVQRDGTTLVLGTANASLLLDSERLLETDALGRSLAVKGRLPGFGGAVKSFVADASGIAAIAASGRNQVAFTGPSFNVVTFPAAPETALAISQLPEEGAAARLATAEPITLARRATVSYNTNANVLPQVNSLPKPEEHYYVVCRVPGGAGGLANFPGSLDLTLSTVSLAGNYPGLDESAVFPRLLVDPATRERVLPEETPVNAYPLRLRAHRLSNSAVSPLYNVFLAGPLTLHGALTQDEARSLTQQLERAFLRLDKGFYVGLSPRDPARGTFLSPFQPTLGKGGLEPGAGTVVPCDYQRNPLIFVPGVMASKLRGDRTFDLWLSAPNVAAQLFLDGVKLLADKGVIGVTVGGFLTITIPEGITKPLHEQVRDYFNALSDLALKPDGTSGKLVVASDVLRSITFFGKEVSQVQGPLLKYLREELGYREYEYDQDSIDNLFASEANQGKPNRTSLETLPDLYPFPYDWRLDCAKNAERLAEYVELIKEANPDVRQVDLIAHSMGGLVSRRYMMDHPGQVGTFISACSPWLGAPKAVNTLKTGDMGEFALNFSVGLDLSKKISRHMPALHQLMPTEQYFALGGRPAVERGWDADGDGLSYQTLDYARYRTALDGQFVYDPNLVPPHPISGANEQLHGFGTGQDTQDDWRGTRDGARIFHIVSAMRKPETISRLRLMPRLIPTVAPPDLALSLPPVEFEDSEQIGSSDEIQLTESQARFPQGDSYRLEYGVEVDRGVGDGTVPLLSQTRAFGSPQSLNAPGTVMLPLVSPDPRNDTDVQFSHAGMLQNQDFFKMTRDILLGSLNSSQQPQLQLTVPAAADEGTAVGLSVVISNAPAGAAPSVMWDTGDGGFVSGSEGQHAFAENGTYTVTCAVGYPGTTHPGAVASARITVANRPPVPVVRTEDTLVAGSPVRLIAVATDPGADDGLTYKWNFQDGAQTVSGDAFLLTHTFAAAGTYNVSLTVTDDDGAQATVATPVTIAAAGAPLPRLAARNTPRNNEFSEDAPPLEFVQVVIGGHDTLGEGAPSVAFSGRSLGGQLADFVVDEAKSALLDLRSVDVEPLGAKSTEMRVYRLDPAGSTELPESVRIAMTAAAFRMDIRLTHHRSNGIVRAYEWQVETEPGDTVELTVPWEKLGAGVVPDLAALTSPEAFNARPINALDVTAPAIEADFDEVGYSLKGLDLSVSDAEPIAPLPERAPRAGEPATLISQEPVFTLEGPPDSEVAPAAQPGGNAFPLVEGMTIPEGSILTEINGPISVGSEPTDVSSLATLDAAENLNISKEKLAPGSPVLTPAVAEAIKTAVQEAFTTGATQPFFRKFLVNPADLLIFEQGTGAALWKSFPKALEAYTPGQSDNDYELFLPAVISPGDRINPAVAEDVDEFENNAFTPLYMEGDWYFRQPEGLKAVGEFFRQLVPRPADENDPAQVADYIAQVDVWRYTVPARLRTMDPPAGLDPAENQVFEIPRGKMIFSDPAEKKSVFDNPATPAAVISFVLTENLKRNAALRKTLPDVSFFPFRREHFLFALMSLEKPPPFGDDPVGDAGMGRSLLLLKWVLEGAFLPQFGDSPQATFNAGVNDLTLRNEVFERLRARASRLEPEGLEWGLYQEFAALAEAAHLKVVPCEEDGSPVPAEERGVFGDFFSAHDKKTVKKVGKAAIRGVLARLATEDAVRPALFTTGPAAFDADTTLPSFEHLIARLGRQHVDVFGGGDQTAELIDDFLAAKIGKSNARLKAILATPASLSGFVRKGFDFLREKVEVPTTDDYVAYVEGLLLPPLDSNRVAEHDFRTRNATAIDLGFATTGGSFRPGRLALHGVGGNATLNYKFALSVTNKTSSNPVRAEIILDDGLSGTGNQTLKLDVPANEKVKFPDPENPALRDLEPLVIERPATEFEPVIGHLVMNTSFDPAKERTQRNNSVFFEHSRIPLGVYLRDGSGSLELGLVREANPAAPTGDCFLTIQLRELSPDGGLGQPLPAADFTYFDSNNLQHPVTGGRLLLNRGTVPEPIAWPVYIVGTVGGTQLDAVELDARLLDVFKHGDRRRMTPAQVTFGNLLGPLLAARDRQPANPDGPATVAAALAPSVFSGFNPIATANSGTSVLVQSQLFENLVFARNEDTVTDVLTGARRTVRELVSDIVSSGLTISNLKEGLPQLSPIPLIIAKPSWNPGRNGKQGGADVSNGQIFILNDILDRALRGELLDFQLINNTPATLPVHEVLKVELYHELVFRLLSAAMGASPDFNDKVDRDLVRIFPAFQPLYSAFFSEIRP